MDNKNFNGIAKPKYITEYRKFGDAGKGNGKGKGFGEKRYLDQLVVQTFISLIVVALALFINNVNTDLTKTVTKGIKDTISWNIDFTKTIDTFVHLRDIIPKVQSNTDNPTSGTANNPIAQNTDVVAENSSGKSLVDSLFSSRENEFIMPVEGTITSPFGSRVHPVFKTVKMHNGIDIDSKIGTPIKASIAGKVLKVTEDDISGKYVEITSGTYKTLYAHCLSISVKEGQSIKQGEIIGEVGDTGVVTGPHLHFEVWKDGKLINPLEVLNQSL